LTKGNEERMLENRGAEIQLTSPNNCQIPVTQWCRKWREKAWSGMRRSLKEKRQQWCSTRKNHK
jgi:hypothetical protein